PEALVREGDAVGGVLLGEPAGAEPELDAAAGHLVDLCHLDGEDAGEAEGRRGHEGAQADRRGLPREAGERGPRVGRAGERVARPHPQVVVGAEEAGEAEPLGVLGEGELVAVRGALLGFDEDAKVHAPSLPGPGRGTPAGSWPGPGCRGGRATAPAGAGDCRDLAAVVAVGPTGPSVGRLAGSHLTCPSRTHFSDHLLPRVPQTIG